MNDGRVVGVGGAGEGEGVAEDYPASWGGLGALRVAALGAGTDWQDSGMVTIKFLSESPTFI